MTTVTLILSPGRVASRTHNHHYSEKGKHKTQKSRKDVPKQCSCCFIDFKDCSKYYKHFEKSMCHFWTVCPGWGKDFKPIKKTKRHIKLCPQITKSRIKCYFCNKSSTRKGNMIRHAYDVGKIEGKCKKKKHCRSSRGTVKTNRSCVASNLPLFHKISIHISYI